MTSCLLIEHVVMNIYLSLLWLQNSSPLIFWYREWNHWSILSSGKPNEHNNLHQLRSPSQKYSLTTQSLSAPMSKNNPSQFNKISAYPTVSGYFYSINNIRKFVIQIVNVTIKQIEAIIFKHLLILYRTWLCPLRTQCSGSHITDDTLMCLSGTDHTSRFEPVWIFLSKFNFRRRDR